MSFATRFLSRRTTAPVSSLVRSSLSTRTSTVPSSLISATRSYSSSSSSSSSTPTSTTSSFAFLGLLAAGGLVLSHTLMSSSSSSSELSAAPQPDSGLQADAFTPFTVKAVKQYNHNSVIISLALASPDAVLDLPVSSAVLAKFTNAEGKDIVRPYTPIAASSTGVVDLLIKVYPNSQMGTHVAHLQPGQTLLLKGPMKKLQYVANGKREIGLVAGGTGITPMLQVIDKIVSNPADKTNVTLLFANQTPRDILLREEIDAIVKKHANVKVVYFVDSAPFADGEVGHINAAKLKQYLPAPADDVMVYVCGPPPFYNAISGSKAPDYSQGELSGALAELGYTKEQVFKV